MRFLFDGSRINPNQTPKDVRFVTRPAASLPPRAPARESDLAGYRESGCPEATAARRKHGFVVRFDRSAFRENLPSPPLSPSQLDREDGDSIDAMMEQVGGH